MNPDEKAVRAKLRRWKADPVSFVVEELHANPDPWQIEVLRAFPKSQRVAMRACKGPGKSTVLAWLAWNFLATRSEPKVAATSITGENLADGLWTEMAKWQNRSEFLKATFEWTKTRIFCRDHPETWWMSARSWAKSADTTQQANTLAGLHADHLLFILDEVGGIPDAVMAAAEAGLATGKETKLLMAGNPTHLEGPLYRACTTEKHLWYVSEVTGDPDDPNRSSRISVEWAKQQIDKYGKDNPWVLVNVFGRFPQASINTLLGPDDVSASMRRTPDEQDYAFAQKRQGIDVARFGDDRTAICKRQGIRVWPMIEMRNARSHEVAARVAAEKEQWGGEAEFVDNTGGYGAGVVDALLQGGHHPVAVEFAGRPIDERYLNKRAEMWFLMAEWVKRGGALPNDQVLSRELTAPTYTFQNGKFRLEDKDQIKARLGFSPDLADALVLTFALPDVVQQRHESRPVQLGGFKGGADPRRDAGGVVKIGSDVWRK